jgi:hypothetical protein
MPDVLDEAFAAFAREATQEILPPGSASVRATVARRRAVHRTAGALGLVLVLIGGIGAYAVTRTRQPSHPAGQQGSAGDYPSRVKLNMWTADATGVLTDWRVGDPQVRIGTGNVTRVDSGADHQGLSSGAYEMHLVCIGTGVVTVTWSIGADNVNYDLGCWFLDPHNARYVLTNSGPRSYETLELHATKGGVQKVSLRADSRAAGRAVVVYTTALSQP